MLLLQNFLKPHLIPAAKTEIVPQNPAVIDENGGESVLLQGQAQVLRRGRLGLGPWQYGQLSGVFQHGVLHLLHGEAPLPPELLQQLVQRVAVFPHGRLLELAVADQNGRCAAHQRPEPQIQQGKLAHQQRQGQEN